MKKLLTLIICLCISVSMFSQPEGRPDLKAVIKHIFNNYKVPDFPQNFLGFECRPDGFYITELENYINVHQRELIYSFEKKEFLPITLLKNKEEGTILIPMDATKEEQAENYISKKRYLIKDAELYPYFGYRGWYNDVIELYKDEKELTDWELHALGRAYQNKFSGFLADYSGNSATEEQFDLPPGQDAMTKQQIKSYLAVVKKNLKVYQRLYKQNPDFLTPVGPVYTKYSDEIMGAFVQLLFHQNEAVARKVLKPGLFDDYLLKGARNLLNSCPPDAVLITWGDNDTYPLYYVQAMEGFRTDVIIANSSLNTLPRYLICNVNGPFKAKPLKTNLAQGYFEKMLLIQKPLYASVGNDMEIRELFQLILAKKNFETTEYGYDRLTLDFGKILMPIPNSVKLIGEQPVKEIALNTNHLFPGKLFQWDILYSNNWERPLCFSTFNKASAWESWETNLVLEGMVYRVYPDSLPIVKYAGQGHVNTERSYDLWMNQFEWNNELAITDLDRAPFYANYLNLGVTFTEALLAEGQNEKAKKILKTLPVHLPDSTEPWGGYWKSVAELFAETGDLKTGEKIGLRIVENIKNGRVSLKTKEERESIKYSLISLGQKYSFANLLEACETL